MPETTPTAMPLLIDWANIQDNWVRALVLDVIQARRALTDVQIANQLQILLREKELLDGEAAAVPPLDNDGGNGDTEEPLSLMSLKGVKNVNALAAEQEISFNSRMTVLFGENAAGKTGYVRVLKRAASVRSEEPIHDSPSASDGPSATIVFKLTDNEESLEWKGESGVHPLTRVDIFDSRGAVLHVDEELLTYTYTPSDLALFPLVHDGIERVKTRLETKRRETSPSGNTFLSRFSRDTPVYPKIESLGPATDLTELEELSLVSEEEESGLEVLRQRVQALGSRTADATASPATKMALPTNELMMI